MTAIIDFLRADPVS